MSKKYPALAIFLSLAIVAGVVVSCSSAGQATGSKRARGRIFDRGGASESEAPVASHPVVDSAAVARVEEILTGADTTALAGTGLAAAADSILAARVDSIADTMLTNRADSAFLAAADTLNRATPVAQGPRRRTQPFLEAPVSGKTRDSLVYNLREKLLYHYREGDVTYEDNELKADYIVVNAGNKDILGTGLADTAGIVSRPEFLQAGTNYTMDTVRYNLDSKKALVQGVATRDGEGFMLGRRMKKMPDGTMNGQQLKYTTCDLVDHPHFYIAMTKAKVIPGKKIITGPAYFVMEDVPIYFLGLPGGFFPMSTGPTAGLVMPTWGEEATRGFYLRGGGYYFTFGDHVDLKLTADIYTLGSWGVQAASRYIKRYKYSGGFGATYNRVILGEKNSTNYSNNSTFNLTWNHSQDPKANPKQNFSANVNFSTAGQKQLATTSLNDHLNTSTTSSVSYSRNWDLGQTTLNLTAAFNMTTNSRDSVINVTLPNISLSVGSFAPLKRKNAVGKQRWWEKITMDYAMQAQNQTMPRPGSNKSGVMESEFFTKETLRDLSNGISHRLGVKTSLNLLNYINFTPSLSYQESWNFKRQMQGWDPNGGTEGTGAKMNVADPNEPNYIAPEFGFFRTYSWSVNGALSTKLYGVFEVKRKPGRTGWLQAIRHMVTPTVSFSYSPDFRHPRYGFYEYVQSSVSGGVQEYLPVMGSPRVSPGGPQASINGSISNQLEIKVKDRRDSTGMKKITILEQLSVNGISWNFLLDSLQMGSGVNISLRTGEIFKGFALQLSGQWDPYKYVDNGQNGMTRTGKFNIGRGKFGRLTSTNWSFGKTFNSPNGASPAPGSINSAFINPYDPANNPYNFGNSLDPARRRLYMVQGWYDFNVPWSFTFNYGINYQYGLSNRRPQISQTLGFNGNITLTDKWGFHFDSGYDFTRRKLSHMQFNLTRDLHCWEMTFNWVPMGMTKMYSFHIGIKSGMLRDIKYDKSSNAYDNLIR